MNDFTIISYCTPNFLHFAEKLSKDCLKWGYPHHIEHLQENISNLIRAFDFKIEFIQDMIQKYGNVLWLDVECRLVGQIPSHWQRPLITDYNIDGTCGLSSGVLMLGKEDLEFVEIWKTYAKRYAKHPDDFVLEFLLRDLPWHMNTVPIQFYERQTDALVTRGEFSGPKTVIQHPSTNRWPNPKRYRKAFGGRKSMKATLARQRKHLFYRNFPGDFELIDRLMSEARPPTEIEGWIFDGERGLYAPACYWNNYPEDYYSKPRNFAASHKAFFNRSEKKSYRSKVVKRMKLTAKDRKFWGV